MATFKVFADIHTTDAAERTAVTSMQLDVDMEDDGSNFDAVTTALSNLVTGLNILSWGAINKAELRIEAYTAADTPNVASNNQIHARSYGVDSGGNPMSFDVVAWDDAVFDQNSFNLLSTAYNTAALAVAAQIRNPETDLPMTAAIEYSVSRTHKSRGKKVV